MGINFNNLSSGLLLSMIAVGCASMSPKLAPASIRAKEYTIKITRSKDQNFTSIAQWAATTFADSSKTVRLQDKATGVLIAKGNIPCDALKLGSGFAQNQRLDVTLKLQAQPQQIVVSVADVVGNASDGYDVGLRPSNAEEAKKAFAECVDPFVASMQSSLEK